MAISPTPPNPKDWAFQDREEIVSLSSKPARPDIIIESPSSVPIEIMTDLLFEDIGGEEILSSSRHDLVNGSRQDYQQIANLGRVAREYSSLSIIPIQGTAPEIFSEYQIQLFDYLEDGEHNVSVDENYGILIQISDKIGRAYQLEVEILPSEDVFDDTIYTEES